MDQLDKFQVFLDCDGVLADFDKRAMEILGGIRPRDYEGTQGEDSLWERIYAHHDFFLSLDPMPDMERLVRGVENLGFTPVVLTGIPQPRENQVCSMSASDQKRAWVAKHLGPQYGVITCRSVMKSLHCSPGDVLIDDWLKYRHKWIEKEGVFIHHTSAEKSLKELEDVWTRANQANQ